MSYFYFVGFNIHHRQRIAAALFIQQQRFAIDQAFRPPGPGGHLYGAAVGSRAAGFGNCPGIDIGAGTWRQHNHRRPRVQILSPAGKGNAGKFAAGVLPVQNAAGIQARNTGAKRPRHPFDKAVLLYQRPLGIQVHHVARPVLNGGIPQPRPFFYIQFHAAGVQIRYVITGSAAAFNKVEAGILFADDQRVFKLACSRCIQAEIGLQRNIHMHPLRHIHKGTARPDRPVQRGELMIFWRYKLHKIFFHNIFVFVHRRFKIRIDDTLVAQFFLHPVIHHFRIVLGAYA